MKLHVRVGIGTVYLCVFNMGFSWDFPIPSWIKNVGNSVPRNGIPGRNGLVMDQFSLVLIRYPTGKSQHEAFTLQ